jgi:hypothetical protein
MEVPLGADRGIASKQQGSQGFSQENHFLRENLLRARESRSTAEALDRGDAISMENRGADVAI